MRSNFSKTCQLRIFNNRSTAQFFQNYLNFSWKIKSFMKKYQIRFSTNVTFIFYHKNQFEAFIIRWSNFIQIYLFRDFINKNISLKSIFSIWLLFVSAYAYNFFFKIMKSDFFIVFIDLMINFHRNQLVWMFWSFV